MARMGDTLEQSLLTNVVSGFCPVCVVPKENLKNQSTKWPLRKPVHYLKQSVDGKQSESIITSFSISSSHEHVRVPVTERLWPGFD